MVNRRNHRFAVKPDCLFSGQLIERERPISFWLNAREIKAFKGDTILSALLAAGIDSAGRLHDEPIALDPGLALAAFPAAHGNDPRFALPMERTKAIAGMELVTPANDLISATMQKSRLATLAASLPGKSSHTIGYNLTARMALAGPWINLEASERQTVDLVVVGAGVGGMSAALSAAEKGLRVALIEQRAVLGGDAYFFGSSEGEERSEDFVSALKSRIDEKGGVMVFTNSVALSLANGVVRVHQVQQEGEAVAARLIRFDSKKVIIAAGTFERLPVFPGNRLPGVVGSRTAFFLAAHYGVWRGNSAAFCTVSSAATRVALLAADLGIKITKLADGRADPKSRFFEFAKAYGVSLATGTRVAHVEMSAQRNLNVTLGLSRDISSQGMDSIKVDRLVVCGGWQPNLTLWHMAGGQMRWDNAARQLRGYGKLENVELAGACAGVRGMSQCADSGVAAFRNLFGPPRDANAINSDELFEHESEDGALPVSEPDPDLANTYLDAGFSFAMPGQKPRSGFLSKLVPDRKNKTTLFDVSEEALSLNDVAAKVALKEIDGQLAEVIAQERCGLTSALVSKERAGQAVFTVEDDLSTAPAYLHGRFGSRAKTVAVSSSQVDNFEVGSLIYPNTEKTLPGKAIGAIFRVPDNMAGQALALVDLSGLLDRRHAIARNDTHTIEVTLDKGDDA